MNSHLDSLALESEVTSNTQNLQISIAGFNIAIVCADKDFTLRVDGPSEKFTVDSETNFSPDVSITAGWGNIQDFDVPHSLPQLFFSGGTWRLYGNGDENYYQIASPIFGERPYRAARFVQDYTQGQILYNPHTCIPNPSRYPIEYPVDELLISNLLAKGGGVEIHACGLVDSNGKGYLFAGQSGDGKTTTSRLWLTQPGVRILSDDRIVIRQVGNEFRMYGTPWHGEAELSEPISAPLTRIFILRKGTENRLRSLRRSIVMALLFARCFPPFHDSKGVDFTLAFLEKLATKVICDELCFVPTLSVIKFVQRESVI